MRNYPVNHRSLRLVLTPAILLGGILVGGCATTSGKVIYDAFYQNAYESSVPHSAFTIEKIQVYKHLDSDLVQQNALYILQLLIEKRNRQKPIPPQGHPPAPLPLSIQLKEDSFVRDFQTWNTVTVELIIGDRKNPTYRGLYSEETKNSCSSYAYLYSLLERTFRRIE